MRAHPSRSDTASRVLVAASGLFSIAAVLLVLMGCGALTGEGACVHGSNVYFCNDASEDECREFWCDDWDYCAHFEGDTCDDVGFADEVVLESFEEPRTPDWRFGSASSNGSGSGSKGGACGYYDTKLNRLLCDPQSSASSCTGRYFGNGSSCAGFNCSEAAYARNDPSGCSVSGGGGGSGSCTSSYQGPEGDPQVSTQCKSIWNYRCQRKDDKAADANCKVYEQLEATVACPYC